MTTPLIDITPGDWDIVRDILQKHVPQYEVWAFGSRAKWSAKTYSDLDLAVITDTPLSLRTSGALAEDFSESELPWRVDVVDWATTSDSFRRIIEKDKVVVQPRGGHFVTTSEGPLHVPAGVESWPIPRAWRRLDRLCLGTYDCPHSTPKLVAEGPYVVRSQDIRSGVFRTKEAARVSETTYGERIDRAEPRAGDLLYSREGTYFGIAAEVPEGIRLCLGQRIVLIRPDPTQLNSRFLRFWLNSDIMSRHLHGFRDGSVAERLNLPTIRGLPVPIFPMKEQDSIACILGTLDDKIELNRRMNVTLEAMARALFKSWFVDFDPVRAKQEGRDPGLPRSLIDLFPSRAVESELGVLPEGWKPGTLADFASLNPETWSRDTRPLDLRYVDLSNTKWGHIEAVEAYAAHDAPSRAQRILRPGDTIVGTVRPGNGSHALICEDGLTGSTGFAVLRSRRADYIEFTYLAATAPDNIESLAHLADGGAYPAVRPEVVLATPTIRAGGAVVSQFSQITNPWLLRLAQNDCESDTLVALRDTLLPKLISGQLRVPDAERAVERAA